MARTSPPLSDFDKLEKKARTTKCEHTVLMKMSTESNPDLLEKAVKAELQSLKNGGVVCAEAIHPAVWAHVRSVLAG